MKDASMLGLLVNTHRVEPITTELFVAVGDRQIDKNLIIPVATVCLSAVIIGFACISLWAVLAAAYDVFTGTGHQ